MYLKYASYYSNVVVFLPWSGFGKFHYYILFVCGSLFAAVAISVTSVSFIMPSAHCDFKMTSVHKGLLNGATMMGEQRPPDNCLFIR